MLNYFPEVLWCKVLSRIHIYKFTFLLSKRGIIPCLVHSPRKGNFPTQEKVLFFFVLHLGPHRLQKYLNMKGFLEKSLKIESAFKSTG